MVTIVKLVGLLTPQEKRSAFFLLLMIFFMILIDGLGVASVMPFMAVLSAPQSIEANSMLAFIFKYLNFSDTNSFLFFLGSVTFILLVSGQAFKAFITYHQVKFSMMSEYSISKRLIKAYLYQSYDWFLDKNSAELGRALLSEVSTVVGGGMMPLISLITQCALTVVLLLLLVLVDPFLAMLLGGVLGGIYFLVYIVTRAFISKIGAERNRANQERFSVVSEAFGAFKEVKMLGLENVFIDRFGIPAEIYARHQVSSTVVSQMPRFALEATAYGGMILLLLILMSGGGEIGSVLPVVTLYAFAGYRLMPALQQIYSSFSQLRFIGSALDMVSYDLNYLKINGNKSDDEVPVRLKKSIQLTDVKFSYPGATSPTLINFNLKIPAYSTVGIIGLTGSGKSTTIDLILGLLVPQKGAVTVDDLQINALNRSVWQRSIGYVPQQIYLADSSVAANIAFGVEVNNIDHNALLKAAKLANLHEFVVNELSDGYDTAVGERGVRLSGGQRQRIGIARALYGCPQILIFDEATSALDGLTESEVMEAISNLKNNMTIIIISHRLSALRNCDQIFLIEKGEILDHGNYEELSKSNKRFREMLGD